MDDSDHLILAYFMFTFSNLKYAANMLDHIASKIMPLPEFRSAGAYGF